MARVEAVEEEAEVVVDDGAIGCWGGMADCEGVGGLPLTALGCSMGEGLCESYGVEVEAGDCELPRPVA